MSNPLKKRIHKIGSLKIRDWILEMQDHTSRIQNAIDNDDHDGAWHMVHEFQRWCYERIEVENHSLDYAGTLLSVPETFFIRILKKEKKFEKMLVHVIYQATADSRDLKYYPKSIKSCFRKCKFQYTDVAEAFSLYENIKKRPFDGAKDFLEIRAAISSWK